MTTELIEAIAHAKIIIKVQRKKQEMESDILADILETLIAHASQDVVEEGIGKRLYEMLSTEFDEDRWVEWERLPDSSQQAYQRMALALSRPTNVSDNPPENCKLVAVHDGDGWAFEVVDAQEEVVALLGWPQRFGSSMTATDLKREGFEIG